MSDTTHTPGPWISAGDDCDWWLGTDEGGPIITASYLGCVEVQNPADMPLIQAAPKLLAALEALRDDGTWIGGEWVPSEEAQDKADAAIAKAKGEQP